jgi:hypothetical protein
MIGKRWLNFGKLNRSTIVAVSDVKGKSTSCVCWLLCVLVVVCVGCYCWRLISPILLIDCLAQMFLRTRVYGRSLRTTHDIGSWVLLFYSPLNSPLAKDDWQKMIPDRKDLRHKPTTNLNNVESVCFVVERQLCVTWKMPASFWRTLAIQILCCFTEWKISIINWNR